MAGATQEAQAKLTEAKRRGEGRRMKSAAGDRLRGVVGQVVGVGKIKGMVW
jgi:hypothetical protein